MNNTIGGSSRKICIVLKRKTPLDGNYGSVLQQNNALTNEQQQGEKRRRLINNEDEESSKKCQSQPIKINHKNGRRESAQQPTNAFNHEKTAILPALDCGDNMPNKSTKTTNRCSPSSIPSTSTAHKSPFLAFQSDQNPNHSPSPSSSSSSSTNSSHYSHKRHHRRRNRSSESSSISSSNSNDFSSISSHRRVHHRRTRPRCDSHHSSPGGSSSFTNEDYSTNSSHKSSFESEGDEEETIEGSLEDDEEVDDKEENGGLPAAFARAKNGDEQNGQRNEDTGEMSDHEMQMMRRRQQLRNKERWHLLKYRLLTASGMNRNGQKRDDEKEKETIEWNEEKEREFVFSLL